MFILLFFLVFFNSPGKKFIVVGEWDNWSIDEEKKRYEDGHAQVKLLLFCGHCYF
jgi:hypothetical protein